MIALHIHISSSPEISNRCATAIAGTKGVNDIRRDISGPVISFIFNTQNSVTSRCRAGEGIHLIALGRCRGMGSVYCNVLVSRQDSFAQEPILLQEIFDVLMEILKD